MKHRVCIGIVEDDEQVLLHLTRAFQTPSDRDSLNDFRVLSTGDIADTQNWIDNDLIDVWIIDLNLPERTKSLPHWTVGRNLVRSIANHTTSAIIVYTSESIGDRASELLECGADDFIRKSEIGSEFSIYPSKLHEYIRTKVVSIWRRVQPLRSKRSLSSYHSNRQFKVGRWTFLTNSRELSCASETVKLTATEHAILRHICVSDSNSISNEEFLVFVLGQNSETKDVRLKNMISRIRKKLGTSVIIIDTPTGYRTSPVNEIRDS